jgi:hypothetical protein
MSALAAEPLWSELQLSWLQAMGHVVYLDRSLLTEPLPVQQAPPQASVAALRQGDVPVPQRRVAPAAVPVEAAPDAGVPAARPAPARRPRVGLPDRLQIALLRASGANPGDPRTQQLMASWPLEQLRADPAAKRALWPQLRALRRKGVA